MDAALYAKMLYDDNFRELRKMQYKYSNESVSEMISLLKETAYKTLPLKDFFGQGIVYLESIARVHMSIYKSLLSFGSSSGSYGLKAMEEEIYASLTIENIDSSRDSIRRILSGYAPKDEMENRIFGMKQGLDFISDTTNRINEENIHKLYQLTVGNYLSENDRLLSNQMYRHDSVFIVGGKVEHQGLDHKKLSVYMKKLVKFIQADSAMDDILKAAAIHFYIAYLHPYFDGNGRMARFIHLWFLVQNGYPSALFIPFSSYINKSLSAYYKAYTQVEDNFKISELIDITPFFIYFIENVYNHISASDYNIDMIEVYRVALSEGKITEKEKDLFNFVLSAYGNKEFSTKQLEKDFKNAAYATIRSFVLKFEKMGILVSHKYGNRVKYTIVANVR